MDDPNEENIESNWVILNSVDIAEEATVLDSGRFLDENPASKSQDNAESDMESDGISIISESSHLHEGSNEDENLSDGENIEEVGDNKDCTSTESALLVKTNWMFVDSQSSPPEMATSNRFYLNCLQEPVQELSEHELGSVQSDLDSDGISIISDCDSLNEFTEDDKLVEGVVVKDNCNSEDAELTSRLPSGIKKYCNGVLIGTILLATSSIFLGHYFNSAEQAEEDLPIYKEEFSNDLKEKVPEKINEFKEKYEVPTALAFCQERHKSDDIFIEHNVKKCLNKIEKRMKKKKERALKEEEINKLNKYLKIKEKYLDEKERFLIKREYELLKAEMKLKNRHLRKTKGEKITLNKKAEDSNMEEPATNIIENKKNYKETIRHKGIESNLKYKKFMKDHKERKQGFLKEYHENEKRHKKKWKTVKKITKSKNVMDNIAKTTSEALTKTTKISDELLFDNSKDISEKGKDRTKDGTNYIVLGKNETINGYWLGRLYKGRSEMRNKRHSGDWYFDRASYRKTKRDKAKWYFDWMMDRELLRYRRSFYM